MSPVQIRGRGIAPRYQIRSSTPPAANFDDPLVHVERKAEKTPKEWETQGRLYTTLRENQSLGIDC